MHRGVATFTLDSGRCPPWLFRKMVRLGREMTRVLVAEYGPDEFVRRIADPVWFQSLGTVLAFDWNASGLTTILTAALKEAIRGEERDLGIFICGGKGKTSLQTPDEIVSWGSRGCLPQKSVENLVYNSRMSAKVDSSLIQDGYSLYHHSFFFSKNGAWAVVQQGMNKEHQTARRYHWFSENISDLVCEPHSGIASQGIRKRLLNMTAKESGSAQKLSVELLSGSFRSLLKDLELLDRHGGQVFRDRHGGTDEAVMVSPSNHDGLSNVTLRQAQGDNGQAQGDNGQAQGDNGQAQGDISVETDSSHLHAMLRVQKNNDQLTLLQLEEVPFTTHKVVSENFSSSRYLRKILDLLCEKKPKSYEQLLSERGVGPKTIRALALVSEVIYGAKPSYRDPARYSFAHGGKDSIPYPIDRPTYRSTIRILQEAVRKARLAPREKNEMLRKLPEGAT